MSRFRAILLVCGALSAAPAFGASPDPKDLKVPPAELSKARELIHRMGSEVYREREEAQAELSKMGRLARQALAESVSTDADPEIRLRCARLLPKASDDELKARIDTFLADTESKYEHDLPGLKAFRKHLGTAEKPRALYVDILKSPYSLEMLTALDKGVTEGGRAIADRRAAMWTDMNNRPVPIGGKPFVPRQPTLPDIAALLFAETLIAADHIPKNNPWMWVTTSQFIQQQASLNALNNPGTAHADAYKSIVGEWLRTRTDPQELTNLSYQLTMPPLSKFKEALPLLRRIVLTEGVQGYAKGQALNSLVQQHGKEEAPFLKTLLNNDSMVQQVWFQQPNGQGGVLHTCLMKDVALAFLISQSGGNIKDYGFETPPNVIVNPGQLGFGQYAFTTEEKRVAGFVKFGWKQLKDGTGGPALKPAPKDKPKETPKTGPTTAPPPPK